MDDLREILKKTKLFLFDLDGTLYLGNKLFPFSKPLLGEIRRLGKKYLFITNNSSKSSNDYATKLRKLGIEAEVDEFITSGRVTSRYLQAHYMGQKVYLSGTRSLTDEFKKDGILITDDSEEAAVVVIGCNTELTFRTIEDICHILCTRDVPYLGTHPDLTCPNEFGKVPDCGAIAQIIYYATGKMPKFIGKPLPLMPELAMSLCGATPEETVVVGDRLDTDVKSGNAANAKTILVFSGEVKPDDFVQSEIKPTLAIEDCGILLEALRELQK